MAIGHGCMLWLSIAVYHFVCGLTIILIWPNLIIDTRFWVFLMRRWMWGSLAAAVSYKVQHLRANVWETWASVLDLSLPISLDLVVIPLLQVQELPVVKQEVVQCIGFLQHQYAAVHISDHALIIAVNSLTQKFVYLWRCLKLQCECRVNAECWALQLI